MWNKKVFGNIFQAKIQLEKEINMATNYHSSTKIRRTDKPRMLHP
jgi:hypothetical protein